MNVRFNFKYIDGCFRKLYLLMPLLIYILFFTASCKKLVEIDAPVTSTNEKNIYADDAGATSVLTGIYALMSQNGVYCGTGGISVLLGLSADELTLYSDVTSTLHLAHYKNNLVSNGSQSLGGEIWNQCYRNIFTCNAAVAGLTGSTGLTPAVKQQLMGEAKFMRAFFFFYLVNLYGDVPLTLSTDPSVNSSVARALQSDVYKQIISDLTDAKSLLSQSFLNGSLQPYAAGTEERLRPTKWAASALLARCYLNMGQWSNAEKESSEIISNSTLFGLTPLNSSFLMNSKEAIWQLQPVIEGHNTEDGWAFVLPTSGPSDVSYFGGNPVYISSQLLNSFETNDNRKTSWVGKINANGTDYYFPYKYKSASYGDPVTEYEMVLRLAEQYLIRSEARAQLSNLEDAKADLNTIRTRAGLPNTTANDMATLLTAIQHERQVELFSEWGYRWLDIKRTNKVDAIMSVATPLKANGAPWQSYQQWYPIPFYDIQKNLRLAQNTGY